MKVFVIVARVKRNKYGGRFTNSLVQRYQYMLERALPKLFNVDPRLATINRS